MDWQDDSRFWPNYSNQDWNEYSNVVCPICFEIGHTQEYCPTYQTYVYQDEAQPSPFTNLPYPIQNVQPNQFSDPGTQHFQSFQYQQPFIQDQPPFYEQHPGSTSRDFEPLPYAAPQQGTSNLENMLHEFMGNQKQIMQLLEQRLGALELQEQMGNFPSQANLPMTSVASPVLIECDNSDDEDLPEEVQMVDSSYHGFQSIGEFIEDSDDDYEVICPNISTHPGDTHTDEVSLDQTDSANLYLPFQSPPMHRSNLDEPTPLLSSPINNQMDSREGCLILSDTSIDPNNNVVNSIGDSHNNTDGEVKVVTTLRSWKKVDKRVELPKDVTRTIEKEIPLEDSSDKLVYPVLKKEDKSKTQDNPIVHVFVPKAPYPTRLNPNHREQQFAEILSQSYPDDVLHQGLIHFKPPSVSDESYVLIECDPIEAIDDYSDQSSIYDEDLEIIEEPILLNPSADIGGIFIDYDSPDLTTPAETLRDIPVPSVEVIDLVHSYSFESMVQTAPPPKEALMPIPTSSKVLDDIESFLEFDHYLNEHDTCLYFDFDVNDTDDITQQYFDDLLKEESTLSHANSSLPGNTEGIFVSNPNHSHGEPLSTDLEPDIGYLQTFLLSMDPYIIPFHSNPLGMYFSTPSSYALLPKELCLDFQDYALYASPPKLFSREDPLIFRLYTPP